MRESPSVRVAIASLVLAACSGTTPAAPDAPGTSPPSPEAPAAVAPFVTNQAGITEMAVDATHLYWVECGQFDRSANVRRIPLDGGAIEELFSAPERVYSLAVAGGFVYVVQTLSGNGSDEGHVFRIPTTGGAAVELATAFNPTSVTVDGAWVYYSEAVSPGGRIMRVPTSGGTPEPVAIDVDNPWDLAADQGVLFYSEMNRGRVMRVVPGEQPTVLASGWNATDWMAVDDKFVYFAACDQITCFQATLFQVPRDGGAYQQVILGPSTSDKIAVSRTNVQWGAQVVSKTGGGVHDALGIVHDNGLAVALSDTAMFVASFHTGEIFRVSL